MTNQLDSKTARQFAWQNGQDSRKIQPNDGECKTRALLPQIYAPSGGAVMQWFSGAVVQSSDVLCCVADAWHCVIIGSSWKA